jgi:hypothetical protein
MALIEINGRIRQHSSHVCYKELIETDERKATEEGSLD